ncbi:MAG: glutaminyl-peptide cyclotransferase [Acidimicrobiaceae bacterium]|nr:glutaminyl-peptide cyclotransferase [Acidimicrobiaceae bacterium]
MLLATLACTAEHPNAPLPEEPATAPTTSLTQSTPTIAKSSTTLAELSTLPPNTTDHFEPQLARQSIFPSLTEQNTGGINESAAKCANLIEIKCYTLEIVERIPHDPLAFTQGLEVADNIIYESTGLYGRSSLRLINPKTGNPESQFDLPDKFFGEGITIVDNTIIQLTWKSGQAFLYERDTLEPIGQYYYQGEGWGLCSLGDILWMSDGSSSLAQRNPSNFELIATVPVISAEETVEIDYLNELECVEDRIIANVWQADYLLVIDVSESAQAQVTAVIDASVLVDDVEQNLTDPDQSIDVLNGIAATKDGTGTLWLTGKLWPYLYKVRIIAN